MDRSSGYIEQVPRLILLLRLPHSLDCCRCILVHSRCTDRCILLALNPSAVPFLCVYVKRRIAGFAVAAPRIQLELLEKSAIHLQVVDPRLMSRQADEIHDVFHLLNSYLPAIDSLSSL